MESFVHASDQTRDDISNVITGAVQIYVGQWAASRVIRKTGPAVHQLLQGEKLSGKDARLLLTTFTLMVYLGSRNAYAGWSGAQRLAASSERLVKHLSASINH